MDNLVFRQITEIDEDNLDIMTNWMYKWWGCEEGYSFEGIKCFLEHSLQKDRLPKTYGIFDNERIVAMFQFIYEDLGVRPDIYPWLANLYVDEDYRNKGVGRLLLDRVHEIAKSYINFDDLYLYTVHNGLYEKFGWEYVGEIDTHIKNPRMQRLYKLDIKKDL